MGTKRGLERLIFFTDAVAAIAITLLILPLVDRVTQAFHAPDSSVTAGQFLYENIPQIFAFVLSFAIIARLWIANHEILEHVQTSTRSLMWLDVAWAFTVVVIPLPTEIVAVFPTDGATVGFYIGSMTASSLVLTGIAFYLYRHPVLESDDGRTSLERLWGSSATAGGFIIALILGLAVPHLNFYALLVLLLTFPADVLMKPRFRKRDEERRVSARRIAAKSQR